MVWVVESRLSCVCVDCMHARSELAAGSMQKDVSVYKAGCCLTLIDCTHPRLMQSTVCVCECLENEQYYCPAREDTALMKKQ